MEKKTNKHNKKQLLIDNLYDYLQQNNSQELQLKPQEYQENTAKKDDFSLLNKQSDLEEYKKDYSSKIDKQLLIISQNIVNSLFALNNQKFTAFMSRYDVWGFDLTMQQFIINFYLVVKTDNMLRQFVMSHMDKLIKIAKNVMEKYLITHMGEFQFRETRTDYNKKKIMDKIKETQKQLEQKLKEKDLNAKEQEQETSQNEEEEAPEANIDQGIPAIQPFNASVEGGEVPQIYSIDDMLKMSDQELNNLNNKQANTKIPQIQDNMNNTENQPQTQNISPEQEAEPQNEEQRNMEQQILANLRREHQNLQKGFTNNG